MEAYLADSPIIDWCHPDVHARAVALAEGAGDPIEVARRCFSWVRDEIKHSRDHGLQVVTCLASEVLAAGSGYCYAKSHLLAALLRANRIPAGFCYQRLSRDGEGAPYCLHGLNAVYLPGVGWYRIDARGNRADVDARFTPPVERLAFPTILPEETDFSEVLSAPLPVVVAALQRHATAEALWHDLPDAVSLRAE